MTQAGTLKRRRKRLFIDEREVRPIHAKSNVVHRIEATNGSSTCNASHIDRGAQLIQLRVILAPVMYIGIARPDHTMLPTNIRATHFGDFMMQLCSRRGNSAQTQEHRLGRRRSFLGQHSIWDSPC